MNLDLSGSFENRPNLSFLENPESSGLTLFSFRKSENTQTACLLRENTITWISQVSDRGARVKNRGEVCRRNVGSHTNVSYADIV